MIRSLVVCVLVLAGCKRDPNEWPSSEVRGFENACPKSFGDATLCKCLAPAVAKKVPYPRAEAFVKAGMKGKEFADVLDVMKTETVTCATGRENEKWPEPIRAGFIKGCASKSSKRENCECLADYAEKKVPFATFLGWGFDQSAGRPAPKEMNALFTDEKAIECLLTGADWSPEVTEQILGDCQRDYEGTPEQCRCYADAMKAEVTMYDFYVVGSGKDGGAEITTRIQENAPKWWLACSDKPEKTEKKTKR